MLSLYGQPREQRIALEHDAAIVSGAADRPVAKPYLAGGRLQESADQIEQRALAATARPDDRDELVRFDGQPDRFERRDGVGPFAVTHRDVAQL